MHKMVSVNKERLIYARKYYGFSLDEVSEKTKINRVLLEKCEIGDDYLSYAQLSTLAEYYNRSLFFFFLNDAPPEDKVSFVFRKIQQDTGISLSKKVKEMMEKANIYRLNLSELYEEQEVVSFSLLLEKENVTDSIILTKWLREKLSLSIEVQKSFNRTAELIEHIRNKCYKIGIYIFKDSFRDNSVSGLCLYDNKYPVILLNNKTTFNRQLFTIFHEVYHLFCKEADIAFSVGAEEKACDKFAGEFLVPEEDFISQIKEINHFEDIDLISDLSNLYTVSKDAIMYRLLSKKLISNSFYDKVREEDIRKVNSETSGGNFYYTRINYLGKPYLNKVFNLYYSGKISVSQVGTYTQLKSVHVSKLASNIFGGGF